MYLKIYIHCTVEGPTHDVARVCVRWIPIKGLAWLLYVNVRRSRGMFLTFLLLKNLLTVRKEKGNSSG